ncbi:MAG: hypothetical protein Aurels2KO_41060 [Aureliella sp.]
MKTFSLLAVSWLLLGTIAAGQETATAPVADPDQAAIEKTVASYQVAFNEGDAKKVAEHFTADGEMTYASGEVVKGREALTADFEGFFASNKEAKLQLVDVSINVIAPSVAIESGTAILTLSSDSRTSTYRAVHVKSSDGWKLNRVQDDPEVATPPSNYEQLKALEWMVGSWTLETEGSKIEVSCRWTTNRNFLMRSYQVVAGERVDFEGTQVIGWDPSKQVIRSWMFDSDGGFGSGAWSGEGDKWSVLTINVVPDGQKASATNIYRRIDDNTIEVRSIGRQVGSEVLGNVPPATFTRTQ